MSQQPSLQSKTITDEDPSKTITYEDWQRIGQAIDALNFEYQRLPVEWHAQQAFPPLQVASFDKGWKQVEKALGELTRQIGRAGPSQRLLRNVQRVMWATLALAILAIIIWSPWQADKSETTSSGAYGWVATALLITAAVGAVIAVSSYFFLRVRRRAGQVPLAEEPPEEPLGATTHWTAVYIALALAALAIILWSSWQAVRSEGPGQVSFGWISPALLSVAGVSVAAATALLVVPSIRDWSGVSKRFKQLDDALRDHDDAEAQRFLKAAEDAAKRDRAGRNLALAGLALSLWLWLFPLPVQGSTPPPPPSMTVPRVAGFEEGRALHALYKGGFAVSITLVPPEGKGPGRVRAESPLGGSETSAHSVVTIDLSETRRTPPPTAVVPNVTGIQEGLAVSKLFHAGFAVSTSFVPVTAQTASGTVAKQSPESGATVRPHSVVTIDTARSMPPTHCKVTTVG